MALTGTADVLMEALRFGEGHIPVIKYILGNILGGGDSVFMKCGSFLHKDQI